MYFVLQSSYKDTCINIPIKQYLDNKSNSHRCVFCLFFGIIKGKNWEMFKKKVWGKKKKGANKFVQAPQSKRKKQQL